MAAESVRVEVDAKQFQELLGKTSKLAPKIRAGLRKEVKATALKAAAAAREEVLMPPLQRGKHPQSKHLRKSIADDIKVVISANNARFIGVAIKAGASKLEGDRKKLVRAYDNPKGWRHPVFARVHAKTRSGTLLKAIGAKGTAKDFERSTKALRRARATWVRQEGRPYFWSVIKKQRPHLQKAIDDLLRSALDSLK